MYIKIFGYYSFMLIWNETNVFSPNSNYIFTYLQPTIISFMEAFFYLNVGTFFAMLCCLLLLKCGNNVLKTHTHCSLEYNEFIFLSHANQPKR